MMAEGVVVAASAGENATASFWREPFLCGSHAFAGGTPLRGAKPCVLGFCVRGVLCVGHGVSWFFANLLLGLWGVAGHWLGVSGAGGPLAGRAAGGGPLARRAAGRRSTQSLILRCLYANEGQAAVHTVRGTQSLFGRDRIFRLLETSRCSLLSTPSVDLTLQLGFLFRSVSLFLPKNPRNKLFFDGSCLACGPDCLSEEKVTSGR